MDRRVRDLDWSSTALGPAATWPQSLKTAVSLMLGLGTPAAICWGDDLIFLYNDEARDALGDKHPAALGRPVREVFAEIWEVVASQVEPVLSGQGSGTVRDQQLRLNRRDRDAEAIFDYTYTPLLDDDGAIAGIFAVAVETTAQVEAAKTYQATERRYRELVRHAPAGIFEIDFRQRRFTSVNDAICEMTGYSREALLAIDPFEIVDAEGQARFGRRLHQWLSGEEPDTSVEYRVKREDGSDLDVLLNVTFTADGAGRPLGATVIAHDITARKAEERRVQRYNRVLRGINRIFEQVVRSETVEALGATCLAVALEVTGSRFGFVGEIGDDGLLHDVAISETGLEQCAIIDPTGHRRPPGDFELHGLYGRAIDSGATLLTNDPASHPDSAGVPAGHPAITSFLGVPLKERGRIVGLLAVGNREGGYGPDEQMDLEALAPAVTEGLLQKRTERALQESEERFRFVATNVPDSLFFQDQALRYVWFFNPADPWAESDIVGKTDADIFAPSEAARLTAIKQRVLATGLVKKAELPLTVEGRTRWYDAVYAPSRNAKGEVIGLVSYTREITDRKLAELALRRSQRDMARAQEVGQIGSWRLDVTRNTLHWSDECHRIFGVPKGAPLTYETFLSTVHPDDRAYVDIQWHTALRGHPYDIEHRIVVGGEVRWVREKAYIETDEVGNALGGFGITQDITERRRTEDALRLERDKLQTVIDNISVGVVITDRDGTVLSFNPEARRIHGFGPEGDVMLGVDHYAKLFELQYPDGRLMPLADWPVSRALRGQYVRDYDVLLAQRGSAESRYVSYTISPIYDSQGELALLVHNVLDLTDRKETEAALRSERQLLQTIFDTIPVMLTVYDPRIESVTLNKHMERVAGWTPEDAAEADLMELAYPDPDYRAEVAAYMQSLAPGFKDITMATKEGGAVETSWANVQIPDGRQVGIGLDISEQKRAEMSLRRYAERLRFLHQMDATILAARSAEAVAQAAVGHIPQMLPCLRASVVLYDPAAEELQLLAVYTEKASDLTTGWRGPVDAGWQPVLERLQRGQSYVVEDMQALSATGPLMAQLLAEGVRAQIYEPILVDGQFVGTLNLSLAEPGRPGPQQMEIVHELTVQLAIGLEQARLTEEVQRYARDLEQLVQERTAALEASEARFRTMFEEAAIGIALADSDGRLLATNPALQQMLGLSEAELSGACLLELLTCRANDLDKPWLELLSQGDPDYVVEVEFARGTGGTGEANVILSLLNEKGDRTAPLIMALVEDITERKQAHQALIRTERLAIMGRMAASLAHEVNNPLQSVLGCLGLAVEAIDSGEDAGTYMDVAMDEVARAARIVHQMRDLGRRERGETEPTDIAKLVEKVVILTHNQAENQVVDLSWEAGENVPLVPTVRDQIQQVFLNLALNAIEAMPQGGSLQIRVDGTDAPAGVRVSFKDTGVGIAPGDVEHMFEAFQSTKELGLGMGLYVSRNIVRDHGGRIDVKSVLGEGSTFTVWLPA